jgi:hypothetical protein
MSNKILVDTNWTQRVRDKLGVDVAYLPDSAIEQPDIITLAEANIIKQLPNYASLTGDNITYLEAAVVCECGALVCPSLSARLPQEESGPHEGHKLTVDWEKMKSDLKAETDRYVMLIVDDISPVPSTSYFTVTQPTRGW